MKTQILGVGFDNLSPSDAVAHFLQLLEQTEPSVVFTPNPEMVMLARKDADFCNILNSANLCVPDGIGVVWASKYANHRIKERVPGIELALNVMSSPAGRTKKWYFLGGAPGVAQTAKKAMEARFDGLNVVGTHDGYFNPTDEALITEDIKRSGADIVLVGLGFPRQERWINAHKDKLGASVLMGVGGSFDVMSGNLKRAPKLFQKLRLEWFYRLLRQPHRIWRQRVLLKFVLTVLFNKKKV